MFRFMHKPKTNFNPRRWTLDLCGMGLFLKSVTFATGTIKLKKNMKSSAMPKRTKLAKKNASKSPLVALLRAFFTLNFSKKHVFLGKEGSKVETFLSNLVGR